MTYDNLTVVNDQCFKTKIKGKSYVQVPERVDAFRMLYPNGCIETEIVSMNDGVVVMKATIKDEDGKVLSTGHAYEVQEGDGVNLKSYIENCETSCVGRALGFLGIGSVSSEKKVSFGPAKVGQVELAIIQKEMDRTGITALTLCESYGISDLSDMTITQYEDCRLRFKKTVNKEA